MKRNRVYSSYATGAVQLLSQLIRLARKQQHMTVQQLAERAGISRGTVQRVEQGDLKCEIGLVFELAAILGIRLFDADASTLQSQLTKTTAQIAVLPKAIHQTDMDIDDEF